MVERTVLTLAKQYADAVRSAKTTWNIKNIYLYGSQARGTSHKYSDIDIAVEVGTMPPDDYLKSSSSLWKIASSVDLRIEPILLLSDDPRGGFLQTVKHTGIAV